MNSTSPHKFALWAGALMASLYTGAAAQTQTSPEIQLGERLFHETGFSSTRGDMQTSCASCHQASDPQGYRAFTEFLSRSWHPWRDEDPGRETLRNTPTLLDNGGLPLVHFDGQFSSLEEQAQNTFTGRNLGWLPQEKQEALNQFKSVLLDGAGPDSYQALFQKAYDIDLSQLTARQQLARAAKALAAFVANIESSRNSAYDGFIAANRLDPAPNPDEDPKTYGGRLLSAVEKLEASGQLKSPAGFSASALRGFKMFHRTTGAENVGNCVACHVPPLFTDMAFHNTGVSQEEYDGIHGEGAFLNLDIPAPIDAVRPARQFMSRATRKNPGSADLGHWNFVDLVASPHHRTGESKESFLARTAATFKTPTLRELASTSPYSHNGEYMHLESVLDQKARAADLARKGLLRNADEELEQIRLTEESIAHLFAFLNALNDRTHRQSSARIPDANATGSRRYTP